MAGSMRRFFLSNRRLSGRLAAACCAVGVASTLFAAAADTRLVRAVRNKDANSVRALLKQHVDVNAPQGDGSTALHWAAHVDDLAIAELLLRAGARPNTANGNGFTPDGNSLPMWFFDLVNLESPDREMLATANATFERAYPNGIGTNTPVGVLSKMAIAGTTLGRVAATQFLVPNQIRALTAERQTAYRGGQVLANRMTLREGPQALDAQRLGRAAEALQLALLQSAPGTPAADPVIRLFPAWPEEWDAQFTLRARGAFVVKSAIRGGRITLVELYSLAGAPAWIRNPWGTTPVTLYRNGQRWQQLAGPLLKFDTVRGDVIVVAP